MAEKPLSGSRVCFPRPVFLDFEVCLCMYKWPEELFMRSHKSLDAMNCSVNTVPQRSQYSLYRATQAALVGVSSRCIKPVYQAGVSHQCIEPVYRATQDCEQWASLVAANKGQTICPASPFQHYLAGHPPPPPLLLHHKQQQKLVKVWRKHFDRQPHVQSSNYEKYLYPDLDIKISSYIQTGGWIPGSDRMLILAIQNMLCDMS